MFRWRIIRNIWYIHSLEKEPDEILVPENSFIITDILVIRACFLFLYLPIVDLICVFIYFVTFFGKIHGFFIICVYHKDRASKLAVGGGIYDTSSTFLVLGYSP